MGHNKFIAGNNSGKGKVLSFGELLLRICPDTDSNWIEKNKVPFFVGGAEANVARALALWDIPSAYITALPDNALSHQLIAYLESKGVDVSLIILKGDRMGLYYLPQGIDMKNSGVIYDRKYSSFYDLVPDQIDWELVFENIGWFHFSAITPALNQNLANICKQALEVAQKKGITISVDLNYRNKLWQYGKQPQEIMPDLVRYCDVVMGNIWSMEKMLSIPINSSLISDAQAGDYLIWSEQASQKLINDYPKCKYVANTFRFERLNGINYYSSVYYGGKLYVSKQYDLIDIVDKVGSGDCYMAGLIYGIYHQSEVQHIIDFATEAAVQKLFFEGDATNLTLQKIKKILSGIY